MLKAYTNLNFLEYVKHIYQKKSWTVCYLSRFFSQFLSVLITGKAQGGVCLYYKDHLPLKHRNDLEFLDESIVVEINLNRKQILFLLAYRSPSQSALEFDNFMNHLSLFYDKATSVKPSCIIITGDFNVQSPYFGMKKPRRLKRVGPSANFAF